MRLPPLGFIGAARSATGTYTVFMSVRDGFFVTADEFTSSVPPVSRDETNLSSDGALNATKKSGCDISGQAISPREYVTATLAVPPRISGP